MKVKVFQSNHNGKIEFTRAELEKLLNEVYTDGYNEGKSSHWTWTSPYLNITPCSNDSATITGTNTEINKDLLAQICGTTESKVEAPKITTTNNSTKPNTYTVTMKCNEADINKAAEALRELLNTPKALCTTKIDDAFDKLAKELNF
jgi:hypothetical protein